MTVREVKFDAEANIVSMIKNAVERAVENLAATSRDTSPSRVLYEETQLRLLGELSKVLPGLLENPTVLERVWPEVGR